MIITRYGSGTALRSLLLVLILAVVSLLVIPWKPAAYAIALLCTAFAGLILNFFRDPERSTPREEGMIISPADGTVVLIREIEEPEYLCSRATQISIFMSPLDVHVNRFPISGKVGYFKHVEGAYMVAFHEKSSVLNERTLIGVEENSRRVLFKQIAGAVARRIVAEVQVGDEVRRGERFGMIKFGSRVDVLVPNDVAVSVRLHDKVVAGETVLGRFGGA